MVNLLLKNLEEINHGLHTPVSSPPPEQLESKIMQFPLPEPILKIGQRIEVVSVDDFEVRIGTQGEVINLKNLGSDITQILAVTEGNIKFVLFSPPDEYKII